MNPKRMISRFIVCGLVSLIGIGGVVLLLSLTVSASAKVLSNSDAPPPITGEVTLWYPFKPGSEDETALMQVIADALAANPGLTITATQIPEDQIFTLYATQVISGGGPDLLLGDNDELGNMVRLGVIRNLDASLQGRLTNVYPTAVEGMKVNHQMYGVPESAKVVGLYYNTTQITLPPTSTASLLDLVQSGKKIASPFSGAYYLYGYWGSFGGQLMNATGRCIADRGGFVPAMQYFLDLQEAGAELDIDADLAQSQFFTGSVSMVINGSWALSYYGPVMGTSLGVIPLPEGPLGATSPLADFNGFYVNPNTTNFTSTVELALFMTSQASGQIFTDVGGQVPVRSDVDAEDPLINTFAAISAGGTPRPQNEQFKNYWEPFGEMVTGVLSGTLTPSAGVILACDEMNALNGFVTHRLYLPLAVRQMR